MPSKMLPGQLADAAGHLFVDIAGTADELSSLIARAIEAVASDADDAPNLLMAALAMVESTGCAADEGAAMCGRGRTRDGALSWVLSPAARQAMVTAATVHA